ncbi:ATP-binding cassette domain-containing protein [Plantactinospora sp. KBS50]|uniref:ATP-binding cassette domain-containing protein n=1 Tax=Plantactinospora sp. KBS50 TaxID=2024580 RepID=UPI000BAB12C8|nr:ATP-binding cassette domain-containing protein [Plantactinospora sp. KBS50]ASW55563.1 hypothetical protein CIK06_17335 [Plantactinospora sp. KBS50]
MTTPAPLVLEGHDLVKEYVSRGGGLGLFGVGRRTHRAVDHVDLQLRAGESVAVVGESGAGKTTVGRMLARLEDPTSGRVLLRGDDVTAAHGRRLRGFRRQVQIVFQNPYESLDPRHSIQAAVREPLDINGVGDQAERRDLVLEALEVVGLRPAARFVDSLPAEISGGQRQRVAIARALVLQPSVLIADEPVSMLDASIRSSVLNLLADLRAELGLAVVFVTHDLAIARFMSERLIVMYAGQVVEQGPTDEVIGRPAHPYTRLLLSASAGREVDTPAATPDADRAATPDADRAATPDADRAADPAAGSTRTGCRFAARCPFAAPECRAGDVALVPVAAGHQARCLFTERVRQAPPPVT